MKRQQRVKQAFVTLLYGMSVNEQSLLLMISNQTKSRSLLRFEGKIEVTAEDYLGFSKEIAPYATLSITLRSLLERVVNIGNSVDWNLIPLVQEVGTCHKERKAFISFNPIIVPYLSEIEATLNYDIDSAKNIRGSDANRFYAVISQYLKAGGVVFSLKELQEEMALTQAVDYFSDYSVRAAVNAIDAARTNIKIKYTMENSPSEEVNPIFTFSVVKRYE